MRFERMAREALYVCLRVLKESNKSIFDRYNVRNSVLIISPTSSLKKWVGREKALASAGHVYSLNIPEKLIYMQPAGFALTEGSNNGK